MSYGCTHYSTGMGLGALLLLIGGYLGIAPILYLAFISHMPLDDLNVGDIRIEHMVETFEPEWQEGHTILRIVWWLVIIAITLTMAFMHWWAALIYTTIGGLMAFMADIVRAVYPKLDPHKIMLWSFWHGEVGSMVWYGSIFVCCAWLAIAGIISAV